ncbi:MAG: UDP-N-acetylmuramate-L-alanine ligase [candidate division CPR2 bacterium GW2011_GWC1_39_9]|uniref:UDP-N-acetylmuramate--L-alanine ligase n=1 Tax=candidate division CPR2 bacterium GW2011_GWC2_39_10 TaxID=1618345 RepID=A0A0G0LUX1_UNCC2|nr:MAG: UDP-N-acetylmuramate-L-alanine ligase [candidate division CPR2 bacterium GW2011_GWC2_39_10]KKR34587.1 MAG: UDP-N-acetylmuramate-L-alanine ligase [candidate division CPR2 bacterium GW2011_GWC1_39_9]
MKYHFIGIGGSGMAPLANMLLDRGYYVSGSDREDSENVQKLKKKGAKIYLNHSSGNIETDLDVVVYSSAIPLDNVEIKRSKELNKKIVLRSELLGELMQKSKGIAIAGTHGKTTTTSLIALALKDAGLDPSAIIGGEILKTGSNYLSGKGEYFVAEACEYQRAFLQLSPFAAIITNMEADHLDYFKDINDIIDAFQAFVSKINPDGFLVINGDSEITRRLGSVAKCKVIYVGFGVSNDCRITNLENDGAGLIFTVSINSKSYDIKLGISGLHNAFNAGMVVACLSLLGVDASSIPGTFSDFKGAKRRLETISDDPLIIDDYGHHPTEISATFDALKRAYDLPVFAIFQPHQYSRTKEFFNEFASVLSEADRLVLTKVYEARDFETNSKGDIEEELVKKINSLGGNAVFIDSFESVADYVFKNYKGGVILTIGAGNINKLGSMILDRYGKTTSS